MPPRSRVPGSDIYLRNTGARRSIGSGRDGVFGRNSTTLDGTLTTGFGPIAATRMGSISDSLTAFGDLYPMVTLKWNDGVHNYMTYMTGDIPVGAYDPSRLSNIGIGHGAIDAGAGYTYLNPMTGHEFSGVAGFTYNFKNPDTQVQSGVISIGGPRSFSQNRYLSVLSDVPISRSATTSAGPRSLEASGRGYSALVH